MFESTIRKCRECNRLEDTAGLPDGSFWVSWSLCSDCVRNKPECAKPEELAYYKRMQGAFY